MVYFFRKRRYFLKTETARLQEGKMSQKAVNGDTIALLKECDSGSKMAVDSLTQVGQYVNNTELSEIIAKYNKEHISLGEEIHRLLNAAGEQSEDPSLMAKTMSTLQTQFKMLMKKDSHEAASLIIDGCNMGIKSLNEYKNKYKGADERSRNLCDRLIGMEKELMEDLEKFL